MSGRIAVSRSPGGRAPEPSRDFPFSLDTDSVRDSNTLFLEEDWRNTMRWSFPYIERVGLSLVLVATVLVVSAAATPVEEAPWFHGVGTQHYQYGLDLGELDRSVEVWIAEDGRYRVVVTSVDGAAEEFTYDGSEALMFVTPPGQMEPLSIMRLKSPSIFAVDGFSGMDGSAAVDQSITERDKRSNLLTYVHTVGVEGASYELNMSWAPIESDTSLLQPSEPAAKLLSEYVFDPVYVSPGEGPSTRSVSSNSTTFWDYIFTYDACVFAKNYRDAEDSYLRAYSSARGDCGRVGVTLWHGSQIAQGLCQPYGFLSSGTSSSGYKNLSTYSAWNTPTCTSHAGWYDGYLVVNYSGLSTVPYGD